ncbi:MAG TPA: GNAT family N-acetyltransferase [Oligoflexia bacterium]|nr:GNAT family N-acetyltransferase [Oligoflexia bacterium]HMP49407.1 GNAT family N-acetyltransferase [Oligoflexia bacterium]
MSKENLRKLTLRKLTTSDQNTFLEAIQEFREHEPDWEFAFHLDKISNFSEYVDHVNSWAIGENLDEGFVPNSYLIAVVENKIIGRSSIRHTLNDFLFNTYGHIGYGVIPSARKKGYSKIILKESLLYLKKYGVKKALVTCDDTNTPSIKTIEANGGILENKVLIKGENVLTRRYWIDIEP